MLLEPGEVKGGGGGGLGKMLMEFHTLMVCTQWGECVHYEANAKTIEPI